MKFSWCYEVQRLSNCPTVKCSEWGSLLTFVMAICFFLVCSFVCLFGSHPETTTAEATEAEVEAIVKCFFCSCYTLSVNCSDESPLLSTNPAKGATPPYGYFIFVSFLRNYLLRSSEQLSYIRDVDSSEDRIFTLDTGKCPLMTLCSVETESRCNQLRLSTRRTVGICDLCRNVRELSLSTPGVS